MSIYKRFYDRIGSEKSNEQFISEIKSSTNAAKKSGIKKLVPLGIAAAATAAITVTCSAADLDLSAIIGRIFKDNGINPENVAEVTVENVYDSNANENIGFEITGSLKDNNWTVFFVEATRTDGKKFDNSLHDVCFANGEPCEKYEGVPYDIRLEILYDNINNRMLKVQQFPVDDGCPNDGSMTFALCFENDDLEKCGEAVELIIGSININEFYIAGEEFVKSKNTTELIGDYRPVETVDCYWSADIRSEVGESRMKSAYFDTSAEFTFYTDAATANDYREDEIEFKVKEITVSDFSLNMRLEAPTYGEHMYFHPRRTKGEVVLKDGTSAEFGGNDVRYLIDQYNTSFYEADPEKPWVVELSFLLDRPIDADETDYVRIGEKVFTF